jgi:PAS domain S-box-containing protein
LTIPAAATALALSLGLSTVGYWAGHTIVFVMSNHLIRDMTDGIHRHAGLMMDAPARMMSRVINDIGRHDIPLNDPLVLARELYGLLGDEPNVDWLYLGNEAGGLVSVGRLADGTRVILMTDDFRAGVVREYGVSADGQLGALRKSGATFDTRQKPWYRRARDTHEQYWTEPYLGSAEPILGISLSAPVFASDGSVTAVCGVDLILTRLSNFMQTLRLGDNGRAFIIDAGGQLIAASGGVLPVTTGADGRELRLRASEADDPVLRETAGHLARHPEIIERLASAGMQAFSFGGGAMGEIYAGVERFHAPGGISWIIVSSLPAANFLGPVQQAVFLSVAIAIVIVAASLVLGVWAVDLTLQPLTALTAAAQAIARGEWRHAPETQRDDEIGLLARAFNKMTASLRQRTIEQQRAEAALRESEERFRDYAETASDWFWETGPDHHLTYVSARAAEFGHEITIGPTRWEIAADRDEDPEKWRRHLDTLARHEPFRGFTYKLIVKDGAQRYISVSGKPIFDSAGRFLGYRGGTSDVTSAVLAEAAVREAGEQKLAAEAERLKLLEHLIDAEEQERRRIARELHDQMGQDLTGLSLRLKSLEPQVHDEGRSLLRSLQSLTAQMGSNLHRIALELRPTALDDVGLLRALETYIADWGERYGIRVDFHARNLIVGTVPTTIETTVYRVVQEALTNVLKHAMARTVSVVLERHDTWLQIIVEDDGKGFDPSAPIVSGHLGIAGMRERLALIGGTLIIDSAADAGTTLYARIPLLDSGQDSHRAVNHG